jgi:hypothetical protein
VNRAGRRIGAAADWAVRARPRWPVIETAGHPLWVDRAVSESLPLLALLAVVGVLRLLDHDWLWLAFGVAYAAFAIVFYLLPWTVNIARNFVAGYLSA